MERINPMDVNKIYQGDCLEIMKSISDKSIDMILCDLPYGTTKNEWDCVIPFDLLWKQYERIIKDHGCIALWAQAPFDKLLVCSNLKVYRYEWIIKKTKGTGFLNANKMPLKYHETVQIFYKRLPFYNPQMTIGHSQVHSYTKRKGDGDCYGKTRVISGGGSTSRYPKDILEFSWDTQKEALHPSQKPLAAIEYINTYTRENDVILDNCIGSGTTAIGCIKTKRKYIGIEKEKKYVDIANQRISRLNFEIELQSFMEDK